MKYVNDSSEQWLHRKHVTFIESKKFYHVMVRDRPNTRHENVSLDFGYTLCWSKKLGVWVSISVGHYSIIFSENIKISNHIKQTSL